MNENKNKAPFSNQEKFVLFGGFALILVGIIQGAIESYQELFHGGPGFEVGTATMMVLGITIFLFALVLFVARRADERLKALEAREAA